MLGDSEQCTIFTITSLGRVPACRLILTISEGASESRKFVEPSLLLLRVITEGSVCFRLNEESRRNNVDSRIFKKKFIVDYDIVVSPGLSSQYHLSLHLHFTSPHKLGSLGNLIQLFCLLQLFLTNPCTC